MPSLQKSGGLKFNGTSDYVNVGAINPTTAGSLESWVKTTATGVYQGIIGNIDYSPDRNGCILAIVPPSQVELEFADASTLNRAIFNTTISDGKFHHIVGTWDSRLMRIYVDGIKQFEQATTVTPSNGAFNMNIGRGQNFSSFFNGSIGATRIYNRALSPSEVQMNYQGQVVRDASLVGEWLLNATSGTVATDTSGNGNHGTLNGGQWGNKAVKQKPKKNQFNLVKYVSDMPLGDYEISSTDGLKTNTNGQANIACPLINLLPNTAYVISCESFSGTDWRVEITGADGVTPYLLTGYTTTKTFTFTTGSTTDYRIKVFSGNIGTVIYKTQLELGSTATPFEPYQLIPDLASVKVKPKKNMFDGILENGSYDATTGLPINNSTVWRCKNFISVVSNQQYTLSTVNKINPVVRVLEYDVGFNYIKSTVATTVTTSPTTKYVKFHSGDFVQTDIVQLELGSTATAFEPYSLVPDLPLAPQGKAIPYRGTDFTFARPSVEPYNGLTVPMDTPRVDGNGVMVEEGTVNLIPSLKNGQWVIHSQAVINGNYSLTLNATANFQESKIKISVQPNTTYTLRLKENAWTYMHCLDASSVEVFANGWVKSNTRTITTTSTTAYVEILFSNSADGVGVYTFNNMQLEQKAYATSFTDNPLGRQAETLTFPTANVLNASAGTIEVWAYEDGTSSGAFSKWLFDTDGSIGRTRIQKLTTGKYYVGVGNFTVSQDQPIKPVGYRLFTLKWNGSTGSFYIDGSKIIDTNFGGSVSFSDITKMYLGTKSNGLEIPWNSPIKSLRISNVARSDQEILDSFNKSQAYMHLPFDDSTTKLLNF